MGLSLDWDAIPTEIRIEVEIAYEAKTGRTMEYGGLDGGPPQERIKYIGFGYYLSLALLLPA
jgi:hypothetical protein